MDEIALPPMPRGLTVAERTVVQLFSDRLARLGAGVSALSLWEELRIGLRSLCGVNVFYVASVDARRRTFTIEYIRHVNHWPEVGHIGVPFSTEGLCARLMAQPDVPYRFAEDGGVIFRSGMPYYDELDAKDAVAVAMLAPDGEFCGIAVVSSLVAGQFDGRFVEIMQWMANACLWSYQGRTAADGAFRAISSGDVLNWCRDCMQEVFESLDRVLEDISARKTVQAVDELRRLELLVVATQGRLAEAYSAETRAIAQLTNREREVVQLLAGNGALTNPQLAEAMGTSVANVKKVISSLLAKTGAASRHELRQIALRWVEVG